MKFDVSDLVVQGLVHKKTYTEGPYEGLSVLKYHNKVFYDNLWHLDERLLDCRGTVVDGEWEVVSLPFRKVFNYGENGVTVDPERDVIIPEKINGFMCAVTLTEEYGLLVSTTGSLDSNYVEIARKWVDLINKSELVPYATYLFEVCDESDPHIIQEEAGLYLIGAQWNYEHILVKENMLDEHAKLLGCKRPKHMKCKFKDIPPTSKEGFMVRDAETEEVLCKIKSPHYLSKKAIMRLGKGKVDGMFDNPILFKQRIDEEFYGVVDYIVKTFDKDIWKRYSDQQRRQVIEEYFYE